MRVLAAMSGGVDSAVAAARMVASGHQVTGVHLALARNPQSYRSGARGCCTIEDARDARRAADLLGIAFYVWDLAERFHAEVVTDFVESYAAGQTPNPCLRCNEKIKFSAVLQRALALGFDAVATGHYARIVEGPAGRELHRAVDPAKDQSYVLGVLAADQLAHAQFPLGDSLKSAVRAEAERRGLAVADKPDSHDICFVADGDTAGFLQRQLGVAPGDIVDTAGRKLGEHAGTHRFTIGQRKGLRIGHPAADGRPRFVLDISPAKRRVTVGSREQLRAVGLVGRAPRWCGPVPAGRLTCDVQLRAHAEPVPATAELRAEELHVRFTGAETDTIGGVAPGQAAVLYDGSRVIGSATIAQVHREAAQSAQPAQSAESTRLAGLADQPAVR